MEEKEYLPVDLSQNTRYVSFDEHLNATCTPEEIKEIKRRNARMSCAYALTAMRIKTGTSRKMRLLDVLHGAFRPSKWRITTGSI